MVRKTDSTSVDDFRSFMTNTLMNEIAVMPEVVQLRYHLFDEIDLSRPDAQGVEHVEKTGKDYHAAFEISFKTALDRENVFASSAYLDALAKGSKIIDMIKPCHERFTATFVSGHAMTLAGKRGSSVAQLITDLGALNQIRADIDNLMLSNKL